MLSLCSFQTSIEGGLIDETLLLLHVFFEIQTKLGLDFFIAFTNLIPRFPYSF